MPSTGRRERVGTRPDCRVATVESIPGAWSLRLAVRFREQSRHRTRTTPTAATDDHNLPLAAPALFNIAYQRHASRTVGWTIVSLAVAVNVGLFIGALIFMASGQSFEQFKEIE